MRLNELFISEIDRESKATRRVLENVPPNRGDWKPHPKSMPMGYLASLVASMTGWIVSIVNDAELDLAAGGHDKKIPETAEELIALFEANVAKAKEALANATDEHLMTTWRLLVKGKVVSEQQRHIAIRDSVISHLAHHRGQLAVYLRINDAKVPSIYGPSADEPWGS